MTNRPKRRAPDRDRERDPEEEGSAAKRPQRANPPDHDAEEEGSSGRSQR